MANLTSQIDNYSILRKIGAGGYGTVFLAKSKTKDAYFALKLIEKNKAQREIQGFEKYSKLSLETQSFSLPIVDFGYVENHFYYVMPLADSLSTSQNISPENPNWEARSLANEIRLMSQSVDNVWFSESQIKEFIEPIFDATIFLNNNALLHRDIKPENILFLNGKARLCDLGLLADDTRSISGIGTPFFTAPSWYLSSGGNPDMYGLACTFYMLISGNFPDLIGRAAYNFPEKIKDSISEYDKQRYQHYMRCIYRALAQKPSDRFLRINDFKDAIFSSDFNSSKIEHHEESPKKSSQKNLTKFATYAALILASSAIFLTTSRLFFANNNQKNFDSESLNASEQEAEKMPSELFQKIKKDGLVDEETAQYIKSQDEWQKEVFDRYFVRLDLKNYIENLKDELQQLNAQEEKDSKKIAQTKADIKHYSRIVQKYDTQEKLDKLYEKYVLYEYDSILKLTAIRKKNSENQ